MNNKNPLLKIYFRIPLFAYFVGRQINADGGFWTKLYLYRKEFDYKSGKYFYVRI